MADLIALDISNRLHDRCQALQELDLVVQVDDSRQIFESDGAVRQITDPNSLSNSQVVTYSTDSSWPAALMQHERLKAAAWHVPRGRSLGC